MVRDIRTHFLYGFSLLVVGGKYGAQSKGVTERLHISYFNFLTPFESYTVRTVQNVHTCNTEYLKYTVRSTEYSNEYVHSDDLKFLYCIGACKCFTVALPSIMESNSNMFSNLL
jgi:hypothetical protein